MSWKFDPSAWVNGVTIPQVSDYQAIAADLHARGANVDGGAYGRANTAYIVLLPGALPGTSYSVSGATWAAGTATLTIGAHSIALNQRVTVSSISPSGYNTTTDSVVVTGITGTTISYALTANPGTYSSGGTVLAGGTLANGMIAVNASLQLQIWNGSAWATVGGNGAAGDQYFTATAGQTTFTPSFSISAPWVYVNGSKQRPGASFDYTVSAGSVVFNSGLQSGDAVEIIQ